VLLGLTTANGETGQITHGILEDFIDDIIKNAQNLLRIFVEYITITNIIIQKCVPFAALRAYNGSDIFNLLSFKALYTELPEQSTSMSNEHVFGHGATWTMGNRLKDTKLGKWNF